ncbi:MAG: 16S rRNA (uracil(1498)-N(3))-methyltransferase [Cellvibrionaceae bacterium]
MNTVLLFNDDFIAENRVRLSGRRLEHIQNVHNAAVGDQLTVGLLGGLLGKGEIVSLEEEAIELTVALSDAPPEKLPVTLVLALPRPKMLKRILQTVATLGVKKLILINSYRVEKSFWLSPVLSDESVREHFVLGLEQGKDTVLPEFEIRKRFKPFVEDELAGVARDSEKIVAHPIEAGVCPVALNKPATLAIGPEGGFIPYEVEKLKEIGFTAVTNGPRILRVETAVTAFLSRLFS